MTLREFFLRPCTQYSANWSTGEMHAARPRQHLDNFVAAGVEFIDENGGGPGVRLRRKPK